MDSISARPWLDSGSCEPNARSPTVQPQAPVDGIGGPGHKELGLVQMVYRVGFQRTGATPRLQLGGMRHYYSPCCTGCGAAKPPEKGDHVFFFGVLLN